MALVSATGDNATFIQDVIEFIDQPLSPTSLNKLKKSCKAQPGYREKSIERQAITAGPAGASHQQVAGSPYAGVNYNQPLAAPQSLLDSFPIGAEIEAQHLHNTTEFNGLRGYVIGHQDEKVLVEFHGGNGQVFDIPPRNLRVISLPATTPTAAAPSPFGVTPPAAPLASYTSPNVTEALALQAKLKCALSHVEAAKEAMIIATQLHILDPELLYTTIAEFQPTLSRANIAKNWAKVVQIYQVHAENVEKGLVPVSTAAAAATSFSPAPTYAAAAPATTPSIQQPGSMNDDELAHNLEGVIHFIDAPLSPRTLREVRTIRHSLSPKRDRQSASPALPQTSQPFNQQTASPAGYNAYSSPYQPAYHY